MQHALLTDDEFESSLPGCTGKLVLYVPTAQCRHTQHLMQTLATCLTVSSSTATRCCVTAVHFPCASALVADMRFALLEIAKLCEESHVMRQLLDAGKAQQILVSPTTPSTVNMNTSSLLSSTISSCTSAHAVMGASAMAAEDTSSSTAPAAHAAVLKKPWG